MERINLLLLLIFLVSISLFGIFFLLLSIGFWLPIFPLVSVIVCTAIIHYIIRSALKRKSDREAIIGRDRKLYAYNQKLENMIEKRQHYRIVYNSFLALGEKIAQPLQSIILINQKWIDYEDLFVKLLDKTNMPDSNKHEFNKNIAQLMVELSKIKEFTKTITNLFSTSIPNLSHLDSEINLTEVGIALNESLEEIRDIYLDSNDLKIDIKPLITIEDIRFETNYIEPYRLKILLTYIFDQPIRSCYLQEKNLPNIHIALSAKKKIVNFKILIYTYYHPSDLSLYFCEEIIKYNSGKIVISNKNSCVEWSIDLASE